MYHNLQEEDFLTKMLRLQSQGFQQPPEEPGLSAGAASLPQYKYTQALGAEAFGDVLGVPTDYISQLKEKEKAALSKFKPEHPERFLESDDKFGWWKEKASLNAMNQIAPIMGFTVAKILQAVPNPVAKVLGKGIEYVTYGATYNANYADTLLEYEQRADRQLTNSEKTKAAVVAAGVSYLDFLAPKKIAGTISSGLKKSLGKGGVKKARAEFQRLVSKNKASLLKSTGTTIKGAAKIGGLEMGTEAAQKVLQMGTSSDPGSLATWEGVQDVLEESIIAGPTSTVMATPGSAIQATSGNREIEGARRQARGLNQLERERQEQEYRSTLEADEETGVITDFKGGEGKDLQDLYNIPDEGPVKNIFREGNKILEKYSGVDVGKQLSKAKEAVNVVGDWGMYKPGHMFKTARDRQKNSKAYGLWNDILQSFTPVGTMSGEKQIRPSFFTEKELAHGELVKPVNEILEKWSDKKPGVGRFFLKIDPDVNDYIAKSIEGSDIKGIKVLEGKIKASGKDIVDLKKDIQTIKDTNEKAYALLKAAGLKNLGKRKNYLYRTINRAYAKNNKELFIENIISASQRTAETPEQIITPDRANDIWIDITEGRDPQILTAKQIKGEDKGVKQEDFERARSRIWDEFYKEAPDFRETNLQDILTEYLSRAATRVASAKSFGSNNANHLLDKMNELKKMEGGITSEEARRVWDMYDASHNIYKRDNVSEGERKWRGISKAVTTLGAITSLGLTTFTSLTELAWIGERVGFSNMFDREVIKKALDYTTKGVKKGVAGKYVESGEGQKILAQLGFNLNPKLNERLDQLFSTDHNEAVNKWFRSPFGAFLTQWTNFNRNWAAQAGLSMMNKYASELNTISGNEARILNRELRENGMSFNDFKKIVSLSPNKRIDILNDDFLNISYTKDNGVTTRVRDSILPWVHKIVEDTVIQPKATNKPLWMSNPSLQIMSQLKTFPIVFGNTVMKRVIRKLNPRNCSADFGLAVSAIGAMAMAYALAVIADEIKAGIKQKDPRDRSWVEYADKAGLTGFFGIPYGAAATSRYGFSGLVSAAGGPGAGLVDASFSKFFGPLLIDFDTEKAGGNAYKAVSDNVLRALGPAGIYFQGSE